MKIITIFVMLTTLLFAAATASNVTAQTSECVTGGAVSENNADLAADCDTLLGLMDTLRGSAPLDWSASTSVGSWQGVNTGGSPIRVITIRLQKEDLDGSIPAGIGDLDALINLWLYTNSLSGPLPDSLGNLSNLKTLMLAWNDMSGQIPLSLDNLTLDRLWLRGNDFTGCVPANLLDVADGDADQLRLPACSEEPEVTPTPEPGVTPMPTATATVVPITTPTPTTGTNVEERLDAIDDDIADLTDWLEGIDDDLDVIDDDLVDIFDRLGTLEAMPTPIPPAGEVLLPSDSPPLGSTVLAGDSTYRVNELSDPAPGDLVAPDEGNRYFAADITQMAGEDEDGYSYRNFSVQDSQGYVYDHTIWGTLEPEFGSGTLGPSETTRGWVTFEVLESAVIISIRVEYDYSEPVAIIAVTGLENLPAPTPVPVVSSVSDLTVADENRCAPYDSGDYSYSRTLEAKIVEEMGGIIYGPYTGTTFASTSETDIEHIVARSEAHDSGLCAVDVTKRKEFAGDLLNLTLASPSVNRHQKGAKDVAEWLPTLNECWFADRVVKVRKKYELTTDQAEVDALTAVLSDCDSTDMIVITPTPAP